MVLEREASPEYLVNYQTLRGLFKESDQLQFKNGSETLVLTLNPGYLRPQYQGEIIELSHIIVFRAGEKVIESKDTTLLSPDVIRDHIPSLQTNFGVRRHYQGSTLESNHSNETLRGVIANKAFALVDEFLRASPKPSAPQPTPINPESST